MTIIDNAVYVDGRRAAHPESLEQTFETLEATGGSMAWIGLYRPSPEEMAEVAHEFHLHDLAVEDAINAHQRPKMERYDEMLFTVLRPARYIDATETVEFGELHVFTGPNYVVTVRHAETAGVGLVRKRLEADPGLLRHGPEAVLYALLDRVVDDYKPVVAGLENDIDEIEDQLFANDPGVSRRIYELTREVIQFQRAVHPLKRMVEGLEGGFGKYRVEIELQRSLRDVHDHLEQIVSRADAFRDLLQNALVLDGTLTANRQNETSLAQNEQVKRISSWAAIFFAPALVTGIYGMNFKTMPELEWDLGYPYALVLMVVAGFALWLVFKWKQWL
ncbi:magnesium and cobalt transport protein CorA [Sinomonas atrocyanea]|uniref:magnesium and cobalt transport protein CorA n=1 Tax=Sinomonas atrocyanea TaxID=37927 RepID=UPI002787964A|nr:magnesium and cobalt transport protein CorA [Sinomonas atrocyanea]MDQ0258538.1 magnesium transporter [Sinomonas atrocyanea]MDR6622882.1 magnesium transporter [Sinomonas atrocyanea]